MRGLRIPFVLLLSTLLCSCLADTSESTTPPDVGSDPVDVRAVDAMDGAAAADTGAEPEDASPVDAAPVPDLGRADVALDDAGEGGVWRYEPPPAPEILPPPLRCEDTEGPCEAVVVRSAFVLAGVDSYCCFDYTGDGIPDNVFGGLPDGHNNFEPASLNLSLEATLAGGFTMILEFVGLDDARDDPSFRINVYEGEVVGDGEKDIYRLLGDKSEDGGLVPFATLPARVTDGRVETGYGTFLLPGLEDNLEIHWFPLQYARLKGVLQENEEGLSLRYAWFGGVLHADSLLPRWNTWLRAHCQCLAQPAPGDLFVRNDEGEWACAEAEGEPSCPSNGQCWWARALCSTIFYSGPMFADVEMDGDPGNGGEGMSVGGRIETAPAQLVTP